MEIIKNVLVVKFEDALSFFSSKIVEMIYDYYYDSKEETLVVTLNKNADLRLFCCLLFATNMFSTDDNVNVTIVRK